MDTEELSEKVWDEYEEDLARKTIGVDISFVDIVERVKEVEKSG
jgi:hypothetical protein